MGSFSWLRADKTTKRNNLTEGDSYKILVPIIYGGGYIKDTYFDYGKINEYKNAVYVDYKGDKYPLEKSVRADLYGVLLYWNKPDMIKRLPHKELPDIMRIVKYGYTTAQDIRCAGIEIGCYDEDIDKLKYPLKLVSMSYKGTYETCDMKSYGDPNQGFFKTYWRD